MSIEVSGKSPKVNFCPQKSQSTIGSCLVLVNSQDYLWDGQVSAISPSSMGSYNKRIDNCLSTSGSAQQNQLRLVLAGYQEKFSRAGTFLAWRMVFGIILLGFALEGAGRRPTSYRSSFRCNSASDFSILSALFCKTSFLFFRAAPRAKRHHLPWGRAC